jgi:toxin ParE1/3/4
MNPRWTVLLAYQAEQDFAEILQWTVRAFGRTQAETYGQILGRAIEALSEGPEVPGSKARDYIFPGIRTLHVARQGYKARHLIVFRRGSGQSIEVLRLLHDSMELARHLPDAVLTDEP